MGAGPQGGSSRQRLIASAERLLRRQGYAATGVSEIAAEGAAPMGSFYHHFPGGKEQLAAEALDSGAAAYAALVDGALADGAELGERLAAIATRTADALERNDFAYGCPVAATALETVTSSETLQERARAALVGWAARIEAAARADGCSGAAAATLATATVALVEGAELMARVQRRRLPLDEAASALRVLAAAADRDG